ncbi:hypothetical protein ABFS82_14G193000 [Erythranthe guttata]
MIPGILFVHKSICVSSSLLKPSPNSLIYGVALQCYWMTFFPLFISFILLFFFFALYILLMFSSKFCVGVYLFFVYFKQRTNVFLCSVNVCTLVVELFELYIYILNHFSVILIFSIV